MKRGILFAFLLALLTLLAGCGPSDPLNENVKPPKPPPPPGGGGGH